MIEFKMLSLVALVAVALVALGFLIRKSRDLDNPINLDDLILETGPDGKPRVSKTAAIMWAAFITASWVLVYKTVKGDEIDTIYTAFLTVTVVPIITAIVKGRAPPTEGQS